MRFPMAERDPCPFCENVERGITSNGVECAVVLDRPLTLSFVHPRQSHRGRLLVIPKRHAPTIFDLTDDEAAAVMADVRAVSQALLKTVEPLGLNVYQNNGAAAGQSVPHYHCHVVPRYAGDVGPIVPPGEIMAIAERLALAEQIRRQL